MDNLLSGLIGALIGSIFGFIGSYYIYWNSQKTTIRRHLLRKLETLYIEIWNGKNNDWEKMWDNEQEEIRMLFHAYYDQLYFFNKRRLNITWGSFIGRRSISDETWGELVEKENDLPRKYPIYKYARGTRIECMDSTRDLMDEVGYNNKMYKTI